MSETRTAPPVSEDLRAIALIAYSLLVLATFNGLTAIAAVVLAYIKRDAARGTPWESHFRNIIHVFWIAVIVSLLALALALPVFGGFVYAMITTDGHPPPGAIGSALLLVPVFVLGGAIFFVWFLYRTLRGLIHTIEARPF
jgi:uncharacterized membrane protein